MYFDALWNAQFLSVQSEFFFTPVCDHALSDGMIIFYLLGQ